MSASSVLRLLAVLTLVFAGCSRDRGIAPDAASFDAATTDAPPARDATGLPDVAPVQDGGGAHDAASEDRDGATDLDGTVPRTSCDLADGHTCTRWLRTDPNGEYACLGYDGLGAVCINDPPITRCDLADGHDCTRWVRTDPSGEYACLGYDGLGAICE